MIAESELRRRIQSKAEWILTPNFQTLVLRRIRTGTYTKELSENLQELRRNGSDQSFPPYFDPNSVDLREVLDQLEKSKFIMHVRSASSDDNLWVITEKGSIYLNPQKKEQEIPKTQAPLQKQELPQVQKTENISKRKKKKKKSQKIKLRRAEQKARGEEILKLREQKRLEKARLKEERRTARLKEVERIKAENRERREHERQKGLKEREEERNAQRAKRDEKIRQQRGKLRVEREERQRRKQEEREEKKRQKTKERPMTKERDETQKKTTQKSTTSRNFPKTKQTNISGRKPTR